MKVKLSQVAFNELMTIAQVLHSNMKKIQLPASNIFTEFRRGHPCGGAKYRWGIKDFRPISRYISQTMQVSP